MDDHKVLSELLKAMNQIQSELQHMNKTLSIIAAQSRPSASATSLGAARSSRSNGYKHGEVAIDSPEGSGEQGFRFPRKKSTSRAKAGKLPPKKGGGYPKKPR